MNSQPHHFLPDRVRDLVPPAAEQLEKLRRRLLDYYLLHGYEFVNPPLIEYAESLTSGAATDLKRNLLYLAGGTDVATGSNARLALRADFTPQVARLDSITSDHNQVRRYCYAGSILLKQPRSFRGMRNPMQLGIELLGSQSESADEEVLYLLLNSLIPIIVDCPPLVLRLSDNRIIQQLCALATLDTQTQQQLITLLQKRSMNQLAPLLKQQVQNPAILAALIKLPQMFGSLDMVDNEDWKQLASIDTKIATLLTRITKLAQNIRNTHPELQLVIDLADMTGYTYHTALTFTLYTGDIAIAQGGRYDGIGHYFGHSRAAIGFSIDMDALQQRLPNPDPTPCVWVANTQLPAANDWVHKARSSDGVRVICGLSVDESVPICCTHSITFHNNDWEMTPIANKKTPHA